MEQPCAKLSLVILNGLAALPGSTGGLAAFPPYCNNFQPHVTAMRQVGPGTLVQQPPPQQQQQPRSAGSGRSAIGAAGWHAGRCACTWTTLTECSVHGMP